MNDYVDFCQADPDFFDLPNGLVSPRFPAAERTPPDGWSITHDGQWTHLSPAGHTPREQGWKVHVSVTAEHAAAALDIVIDHCLAARIPVKFLTSPRILLLHNGKYAPRGRSGKLMTIYPPDDDGLGRVLTELDDALGGLPGPYILGDLRWRKGPLYVRFGGFLPLYCRDAAGREVLAVRAPDGRLVPDVRGPSFAPPAWAPLPDFLAAAVSAAVADDAEALPYEVERALHFSNGGGIYLGRDPGTGERVVLREARPYAGLDGAGRDAVTRLYQEADALRALSDLDFVPRLHGTRQVWEHHYLVEEYVAGETLWNWMAAHNPMTGEAPHETTTAEYTATVLGMLEQLEGMLDRLHERGYVYADLHPRNVIVRPDGRLALVDFEIAYRPGVDPEPTIGCPGFVADHVPAGQARDRYALDCLRVALFLPLTVLLDSGRVDPDDLVDAVAELFPVTPALTRAARAGLRRPHSGHAGPHLPDTGHAGPHLPGTGRIGPQGPGTGHAGPHLPGTGRKAPGLRERFGADGPAGLRGLIDGVTDAINEAATPGRTDRLFPGDPRALTDGGYNLAYGAAGVLAAMRYARRPIDPGHVDWLATAVRRAEPRAGLYTGLAGAALVLDALGRHGDAADAMDRAVDASASRSAPDLFDGLSGVGLALRHFARTTGEAYWAARLDTLSDRLAEAVRADPAVPSSGTALPSSGPAVPSSGTAGSAAGGPGAAGLLHGRAGAAVFFLRRYADTGDGAYLEPARRALDADLARCMRTAGGAMLLLDRGNLLPYLGNGSAGLAGPLGDYLTQVPDELFTAAYEGILAGCNAEFTVEPGLFTGRAGLLLSLAAAGRTALLTTHVRRLGWHAVQRSGGIPFPGRWLLRLSMDLGTGGAGVLLALRASEIALYGSEIAPYGSAIAPDGSEIALYGTAEPATPESWPDCLGLPLPVPRPVPVPVTAPPTGRRPEHPVPPTGRRPEPPMPPTGRRPKPPGQPVRVGTDGRSCT